MITGKRRQVYTIAAVTLMLLANFLANAIPINNTTTEQVSNLFNVLFMPAGYVFSIWGVIYIGLISFAVYQDLKRNRSNSFFDSIFPLVFISCVANATWIIAWHYVQIPLTVVLMLILLLSLIAIQIRIYKLNNTDRWFYAFVRVPFNIYLAWISVATIANVAIFLYTLGWNRFGFTDVTWTVVMIAIATGLAGTMSIKRKDIFFPAVVLWAIVGILVKFPYIEQIKIAVVLCEIVLIGVIIAESVRKAIMIMKLKQLRTNPTFERVVILEPPIIKRSSVKKKATVKKSKSKKVTKTK